MFVNKSLIDHVKQCGFTADLLTVVGNRIARAFSISGYTQVAALDILNTLEKVWHADLL